MFPYIILVIVFCILSEYKYKYTYIFRIPALIVLILFVGLRNEIGTDYHAYKDFFYISGIAEYGEGHMEVGWHFLNKIVLQFTDEFKGVTLIHAVIIVVLLHQSIKDFEYYTFAFVLFILAESGYIFIVNGMRQGVAMAVFLYSWRYIKSRELLKYVCCIILGATIHLSIIFVAPVYWLAYRAQGRKFYIVVSSITLFMYYTHITDRLFFKLISYTPYVIYIEKSQFTQFLESGINGGFAFIVKRVLYFLVLLYSPTLQKGNKYTVWLNMFFYMIILGDLFANITILGRMTHYFAWSIYVVLPLWISKAFKPGVSRLIPQAAILILYIILFTYRVYTDIDNHLLYTL